MTKKQKHERSLGDPCSSELQEQVHLDRISYLPDNVILQILMRLPIREAVGTSRLSTTWRYRWMSIPELVFDDLGASYNAQKFDKWVDFINSVLLLHEGNITGFEIRNFLASASSSLDRWLLFLSRKKLNKLCIQFRSGGLYVCPMSLFSFRHLAILVLVGCRLPEPPQTQFKGFRNLTFIGLKAVIASKETIESLVKASPFLSRLFIRESKPNVSCLNLCAPNLTHCTIRGKCEHITFTKPQNLTYVDIDSRVNGKAVRCKLDVNLGKLLQLQEARICLPFMECLSVNNFMQTLPITYHRLKTICLEICFEDPKQILAAFWLFRNSPSLKKIFISCVEHFIKDVSDEGLCLDELYEMLGKEEAILQRLKVFELGGDSERGFKGSENELKLIEFMLLKASVLQTMTVNWSRNAVENIERVTNALVELVKFQRTSSKVKINISSPPNLSRYRS